MKQMLVAIPLLALSVSVTAMRPQSSSRESRNWAPSGLAASTAEPGSQPDRATVSTALNALTAAERAAGWKLLFDGRTLSGWTPSGDADWKVDDGALAFTKGRGVLQTVDSFANFELRLEFWAEKTANTGLFVRVTPVGKGDAFYEVNIFDSHETAPTGSILFVSPGTPPATLHSVLPARPDTAEKWNAYEVNADGSHLIVKLNGQVMTDIREEQQKLTNGPIRLQAGGPGGPGAAKFRTIRIRTL